MTAVGADISRRPAVRAAETVPGCLPPAERKPAARAGTGPRDAVKLRSWTGNGHVIDVVNVTRRDSLVFKCLQVTVFFPFSVFRGTYRL